MGAFNFPTKCPESDEKDFPGRSQRRSKLLIGSLITLILVAILVVCQPESSSFGLFEKLKRDPEQVDINLHVFLDKRAEEMKSKIAGFNLNQLLFGAHSIKETSPNFDLPLANITHLRNLKIPDQIDWRDSGKVTPVKCEYQCLMSDWSFATVAVIESLYAIKNGELLELSEQELIDCNRRNHGCRGGDLKSATTYIIEKGLGTEKDYPYTARFDEKCQLNKSDKKRVNVESAIGFNGDENAMAAWVATVGPVAFDMILGDDYFTYEQGIFNPKQCPSSPFRRSSTIVGYGTEGGQPYWIVKNSWGTLWGDKGYMKVARGKNVCGMADNALGYKI